MKVCLAPLWADKTQINNEELSFVYSEIWEVDRGGADRDVSINAYTTNS